MLIKYLGLLSITVFIFTNFIACGAQMYKVSVKEDIDYSKMPAASANPEAAEFGIHAISGWKELPIKFKTGHRLTAVQKAGLLNAMKTWEKAVGRELFEFVGTDSVDGDDFKDLFSSLSDGVNGHYLDMNWEKTGKPSVVLATTIWDNSSPGEISTADIRFNSFNYIITDSMNLDIKHGSDEERDVVDMETLALHELGHLLGLAHVGEEYDPYSIMNPSLYIGEGLSSRKISRGDIERIQRIYSCEGTSCDIDNLIIAFEQNKEIEEAEENVAANKTSESSKTDGKSGDAKAH